MVLEAWNALGKNVASHEFFATSWLVHHHLACWSKSVVDETGLITFESDFTAGTIFEGAKVVADARDSRKGH